MKKKFKFRSHDQSRAKVSVIFILYIRTAWTIVGIFLPPCAFILLSCSYCCIFCLSSSKKRCLSASVTWGTPWNPPAEENIWTWFWVWANWKNDFIRIFIENFEEFIKKVKSFLFTLSVESLGVFQDDQVLYRWLESKPDIFMQQLATEFGAWNGESCRRETRGE